MKARVTVRPDGIIRYRFGPSDFRFDTNSFTDVGEICRIEVREAMIARGIDLGHIVTLDLGDKPYLADCIESKAGDRKITADAARNYRYIMATPHPYRR